MDELSLGADGIRSSYDAVADVYAKADAPRAWTPLNDLASSVTSTA